jgi:hypothetical protein
MLPDNLPGADSYPHEIADFCEFECLKNGAVSQQDVIDALELADDTFLEDGIPAETMADSVLPPVFSEIEERTSRCGDNTCYPFRLESQGHRLVFDASVIDEAILYVFLLLATRLNMQTNKIHDSVNATELFEHLCAAVTRQYLGPRSNAIVFGTGTHKKFSDKVKELSTQMYGECCYDPDGYGARVADVKDDSLDIVAWVSFSDKRHGQIIGMGQCKTGTSWRSHLNDLQPQVFFLRWARSSIVPPVRMFFLAETIGYVPATRANERNDREWTSICSAAGLLFDRCRIMDYRPVLPDELKKDMIAWLKAVAQQEQLGALAAIL